MPSSAATAGGHWRRLKPGQMGEDQAGNAVPGRTWVDREETAAPAEKEYPPWADSDRKKADFDAWDAWQKNPTEENLGLVLDRVASTMQSWVNDYKSAPIPSPALYGVAVAEAVKQIKSFDPTKGSALHTHVYWGMYKVRAFAGTYQNFARIPDNRLRYIGVYKRIRADLVDKYGYVPDAKTILESLQEFTDKGEHWSLKEVERMEAELSRADLVASKNLDDDLLEGEQEAIDQEKLSYVYEILDHDQRVVFDYLLGEHGKTKISKGEVAKRMGWSPSKVSRVVKQINGVLEEYGL